MAISLPLESMSVEEKLRVMEDIWDDLSSKSENIASPLWHLDELSAREDALTKGSDEFTDWELAKKEIRDSLNEN
ncbi:addiction module protein [Aliikangiella coralliicola]|uniref:Addiction module protein n=1 Tax=Aliikangiella coralliicola TaxID=2592383 RepID=A0A545TWD1_9GAMM|nr:addiction module protein [Aliikangiella coralliicola]TQV81528.1 addiction module protein [Aliikangiella coralliicola]